MANHKYSYPTELTLTYSNDFEYRKSLRQLFQMNSTTYPDIINADIDPVSRDELEYDEQSTTRAMNFVIEQTRSNPLFYALYEQAATFMFSTDIDIGLAVLFSYDYMLLFHNCLKDYFKSLPDNTDTFQTENENYQILHKKIFTKR